MGDTHITGRHIGGGTHITSDMCAGIHISLVICVRGYTYHGGTHITATPDCRSDPAGRFRCGSA